MAYNSSDVYEGLFKINMELDPDTQIHWRHDTPGAAPRDNMVFHDTQNAKTGVPVVDSGIGGGICGTR